MAFDGHSLTYDEAGVRILSRADGYHVAVAGIRYDSIECALRARAMAAGRKADATDEWVDQAGERLSGVGRSDLFLSRTRMNANNRGNIQRRRQVIGDCVQHLLYALVLQRTAAENRNQRAR